MRLRRLPALLVALIVAASSSPAQESASRPAEAEADRPYPKVVTEATRRDEARLKALEAQGKPIEALDFEGEAPFKRSFEVQGLDSGTARIETDPKSVHKGRRSLRLESPARDGKSSGSSVHLWLGDDGHERVHLRYYLKFAADYDQGNLNHTGGGLSGVAGTDKWRGMGGAGLRPKGDDSFSTRLEPWKDWGREKPPGAMFLYTYWMDMKRDKDGNFWGNMIEAPKSERFIPERDRWYAYEVMVKTNSVGKADGELAAWIDGKLHIHAVGFRWRSTPDVKLKRSSLLVYVHEARRSNVVHFDDVVLSTGYIGLAP